MPSIARTHLPVAIEGSGVDRAPGHAPVALIDCEHADISPSEDLERVVAHLTGG